MIAPLVHLQIGRGYPIANDHVHALVEHHVGHLRQLVHWVSVVAIDDDIAIGIDVAEQGAQDIASSITLPKPSYNDGKTNTELFIT